MPSRMTTIDEERAQVRFAERAAKHFAAHPECSTFGDLEPGTFLAIRWGLGEDCVLLLKLDDCFQRVNYQNIVGKFKNVKC